MSSLSSNMEAMNELSGIGADFSQFDGKVKFDIKTKMGSVLDVIQILTDQSRDNCGRTLKRIKKAHPEITGHFAKMQINGEVYFVFFCG